MANTYLKSVKSFGYKAQSATATALTIDIDGYSGGRVSLKAFGFTCANIATSLYFLPTIATTTVNGAVASGNTTMTVTANTIGGSTTGAAALAANDHIVMQMDDGTYHFTTVASVASTVIEFNDALDDTMANGNTVWGLGAAGDNHGQEYLLTVSSQNTKELESGLFYGTGKGYPARLYYLAASATALASVDYVTIDYINS